MNNTSKNIPIKEILFRVKTMGTDVDQIKRQIDEDIMNDAQIKTGLKLSEAIKYCEENEGALIRPSDYNSSDSFQHINFWQLHTSMTYDVKLPPPKSVSVTWDFVDKVLSDIRNQYINEESRAEIREKLGL